MTLFITRLCTPLILRLSSGIHNAFRQKIISGQLNFNKHAQCPFICSKPKWMSTSANSEEEPKYGEKVKIFFKLKSGEIVEAENAREGMTLMQVAMVSQIGMEGSCEGGLSCTTCHLYVPEDTFEMLPEAVDKEQDVLDTAPFLRPNSRLSCQITITKELEGVVFIVPPATRNMHVDKN